ncbi:hypothetical protein A2699_05480 [Candidatus Gottesmanbacteria bacterium RIFCSPHIGHO2_01_FULL_43_15]|nr:MAG: hypothetical protein A2699_05480 [Candidatus Gottesmanbacteria bacterium RIFCSPHIGHO2_01_FULL_43_15]
MKNPMEPHGQANGTKDTPRWGEHPVPFRQAFPTFNDGGIGAGIDLTISLITRNSVDLILRCLDSIYKQKGLNLQVLLVDNGSTDQTAKLVRQRFPRVAVTRNKSNLLFTKAHNQNLKKARGRYFLVVNDDTLIPKNTLPKIVRFMDTHPQVGIAGCLQKKPDGQIEMTGTDYPTPLVEFFDSTLAGKLLLKLFPLPKVSRLLKNYRYTGWDRRSSRTIGAVSGAFFMGRSDLLKTIGLFDENLWLYFEELDYCARAKARGWSTYHVANVAIIHLHTQTIIKLPAFFRYRIAEHDTLAYYKKYFGDFWHWFLWLAYRPNWLLWKLRPD